MIAEFDYERYHHPHLGVQQKMEVLYLKSLVMQKSPERIAV
jgi:hypothetical protein